MKLSRNDLCWCKSQRKYKNCHARFDNRVEFYKKQGYIVPPNNIIKTPEQIIGIRESGKINIAVLDYIAEHIQAGITTEEINQLVYEKTIEYNAVPAQLGYQNFPKSVCTSINEQVCHGVPAKDVILKSGDIINIDVSSLYQGYFSDSSRMFCIGDVCEKKKNLIRVTQECIDLGVKQVRPWGFIGDIGQAIHEHAMKSGYSVVREIGGHGIGLEFHEEPWVSFVSKKKTGMLMVPGMVFTIEPMINEGTDEIFLDKKNGWSFYTVDGLPSSQEEIMVLVTSNGYEVLAH